MKEPKVIMHGLPRMGKSWVEERYLGNMGRTEYDDTQADWSELPIAYDEFAAIERRILQRTYGRLGSWFLQSWLCPASLLLCAAYGGTTRNGAGFWRTVRGWLAARKGSRK